MRHRWAVEEMHFMCEHVSSNCGYGGFLKDPASCQVDPATGLMHMCGLIR